MQPHTHPQHHTTHTHHQEQNSAASRGPAHIAVDVLESATNPRGVSPVVGGVGRLPSLCGADSPLSAKLLCSPLLMASMSLRALLCTLSMRALFASPSRGVQPRLVPLAVMTAPSWALPIGRPGEARTAPPVPEEPPLAVPPVKCLREPKSSEKTSLAPGPSQPARQARREWVAESPHHFGT